MLSSLQAPAAFPRWVAAHWAAPAGWTAASRAPRGRAPRRKALMVCQGRSEHGYPLVIQWDYLHIEIWVLGSAAIHILRKFMVKLT